MIRGTSVNCCRAASAKRPKVVAFVARRTANGITQSAKQLIRLVSVSVCVCSYILYHMMCINYCLLLTLIAIGKCQKSFALLEDSLLGADEPCPACQELECDACIKSTSCSWCRLPVASTGLAVFGCESGLTCKASFAGFGVKPLTNVTACNVSYNDLNLDALKDVLQKVRFVFSVFFSLVFRFSLTFVYR